MLYKINNYCFMIIRVQKILLLPDHMVSGALKILMRPNLNGFSRIIGRSLGESNKLENDASVSYLGYKNLIEDHWQVTR